MIQYKSQQKQFLKIKSSLFIYVKTSFKGTLLFPPVSPTVMAKVILNYHPTATSEVHHLYKSNALSSKILNYLLYYCGHL